MEIGESLLVRLNSKEKMIAFLVSSVLFYLDLLTSNNDTIYSEYLVNVLGTSVCPDIQFLALIMSIYIYICSFSAYEKVL